MWNEVVVANFKGWKKSSFMLSGPGSENEPWTYEYEVIIQSTVMFG